MTGHTLTLDIDSWDITLDVGGNIATSFGAYAIAQNVANTVRLFTNDAYYDPDRGIPHFAIELGKKRNEIGVLRSRIVRAATDIDGVQGASVEIYSLEDRVLSGNISLTLETGETADVTL